MTRKTDKKSIVNIPEPGYNEGKTGTKQAKSYKDFLNLRSEEDDVSPELANLLKFLIDGEPVDDFTERLVEAAKKNKAPEV